MVLGQLASTLDQLLQVPALPSSSNKPASSSVWYALMMRQALSAVGPSA
ncbi:hypothetical protein [Lacticaseibacillus camelliae]|nr:hypothetical protein [Lacticaseibacillus camelliae]